MSAKSQVITETRRNRVSYSISFKLDVSNYFRDIPSATVSGAARFFNLSRKQIRYYRRNEELYRGMATRRQRRNVVRLEQIRMRAKYPDQESNVFRWFIDSRREGE